MTNGILIWPSRTLGTATREAYAKRREEAYRALRIKEEPAMAIEDVIKMRKPIVGFWARIWNWIKGLFE